MATKIVKVRLPEGLARLYEGLAAAEKKEIQDYVLQSLKDNAASILEQLNPKEVAVLVAPALEIELKGTFPSFE